VKLLLWMAVGLVVVLWLLHNKKISKKNDTMRSKKTAANAATHPAESMIQCAHCGTHIPASESIAGSSGSVFCSEEHRRLHR
jgi:uncharacterized protein